MKSGFTLHAITITCYGPTLSSFVNNAAHAPQENGRRRGWQRKVRKGKKKKSQCMAPLKCANSWFLKSFGWFGWGQVLQWHLLLYFVSFWVQDKERKEQRWRLWGSTGLMFLHVGLGCGRKLWWFWWASRVGEYLSSINSDKNELFLFPSVFDLFKTVLGLNWTNWASQIYQVVMMLIF